MPAKMRRDRLRRKCQAHKRRVTDRDEVEGRRRGRRGGEAPTRVKSHSRTIGQCPGSLKDGGRLESPTGVCARRSKESASLS